MPKLRIAFLASNNGTSFRALTEEIRKGHLNASSVLLVSNSGKSSALEYAGANDIASCHIPTKDREVAADGELHDALKQADADLVILSGYLRKLGPCTLAAFEGRILNVHPGLLPKYGGHGMYGRRVHQTVLDNGERVTGATVHLVDAEYDHGRTIASVEVSLEASDDVTMIENRVMKAECQLFIDTVRRIAAGELLLPL